MKIDDHAASHGELVIYSADDGSAQFYLRAQDGTVWLTQAEIAALFQTTPQNITQHVRAIYAEGEASEAATCKADLQVQTEGTRQVRRTVKSYNLEMILAVGFRVKSPRGTQFRQWATAHLKQYLVKGFVMDDARLKDPASWDYFDELLQRIRDIRASEKRFYQKVRDLLALSVDYQGNAEAAGTFFAEVQNKMLFAVTQLTAAEIVTQRADPAQPNMALTAWKGQRVRKVDVSVAKNYLNATEVDELNRIAVMFLDYAEDRTKKRQDIRMGDWRQYVDSFLSFNERPLLKGSGKVTHARMEQVAFERYAQFDARRVAAEAVQADETDIKELEQIKSQITTKGPRR